MAAHAAAPRTGASTLYVDNTSSDCTNSGSGTAAVPFCTIQAAANVVNPGQTVLISGWKSYNENVTVTRSGTASAPITFAAASTYFTVDGSPIAFTVVGAANVVISGLNSSAPADALDISHSSNITVMKSAFTVTSTLRQAVTPAAVHVLGSSTGVIVEQSRMAARALGGSTIGVLVDTEASGTVITTNSVQGFGAGGIVVGDQSGGATGTDVTSNTVDSGCNQGISVFDYTSSTTIENNVITDMHLAGCSPTSGYDLDVTTAAGSSTTAKYNVLSDQNGSTTPYHWAGTAYFTAANFQSATGQGAQDAVVPSVDMTTAGIPTSSPLLGTADTTAPGELSTDIYGNARLNNRYDRGAFELAEYSSDSMSVVNTSPQAVWASIDVLGVTWGSSVTETYNWGDGTTSTATATPDLTTDFRQFYGSTHTYHSRGTYIITETLTDGVQTTTQTATVNATGETYVPVNPTRVLDTRFGIGTGGSEAPVGANSSIAVDVSGGVPGAPAAGTIEAVVMNVTVTGALQYGAITAYPDGTPVPTASNLNYVAGQNIPNLVTVKVGTDGKVDLYNSSPQSTHLIADVSGYYVSSSSGSGFIPMSPTRLLDTRDGTGTGGSTKAVPGNGTISLKIAGNGPIPSTGVTAVALNVTATAESSFGFVTVFPGGTTLPNASNLNYSSGQNVANMVVVPVGANGTISLTNTSSGSTHLVADVAGYYTSTGGHAFIALNPTRVLDSRDGFGEETANPYRIAGHTSQRLYVDDMTGIIDDTACVMNLTVTGPDAIGFITAYPDGTSVPTASNLNFSAGQTIANMAMVSGPQVDLYNGSAQSTDLVADLFGYFS